LAASRVRRVVDVDVIACEGRADVGGLIAVVAWPQDDAPSITSPDSRTNTR